VTTDSDAVAEFVKRQRSHGMTAASYDKHRGHAFSYDVVTPGYNYRLTEMQAALGLVQLGKLDRNNARRRALVASYRERLAGVPGLVVPFPGRDPESSCHVFVVVLPDGTERSAVQAALKAQGIQTSIHYQPVHRFTRFRDAFRADVPRLEAIADRLLTLPLHPRMTPEDVAFVATSLREALA